MDSGHLRYSWYADAGPAIQSRHNTKSMTLFISTASNGNMINFIPTGKELTTPCVPGDLPADREYEFL